MVEVELEEEVELKLVELVEREVELCELEVDEKDELVELCDVLLLVELCEVLDILVLEMLLLVDDTEVEALVELMLVEEIELLVELVDIVVMLMEYEVLEVERLVLVELKLVELVLKEEEVLLVEKVEAEVLEVEVVVPAVMAGKSAIVLIVQLSKAPIASHCMFCPPAASADLSDWPPEPTAPVTLDRWFCPAPTVMEVSVVATASISHAPSVTMVVDMEADPPPAPVVPVVPFWASTTAGICWSTPVYELAIVALTEALFRVMAILLAPVAGARR